MLDSKMDNVSLQKLFASLLALVVLLLVLVYTYKPWKTKRAHRNSIPEASGARLIIGHLHLLATQVPPHRVLGDMADKHGPIFAIKLGTRRALVVSSWEVAKECLGDNDQIFLTRPSLAASKYLGYNGALFAFSPYGPYWRKMRLISTKEILSNTRLEFLKPVRSSELNICTKQLFSLCENGPAKVDMSEWFSHLTMNVMLRMIAGMRSEDMNNSGLFLRVVRELMGLFGMFLVSDMIPFTEWMDVGGHIKSMKRVAEELDYFVNCWLEEHVRKRREGKVKDNERDFIDVMLETIEQFDSFSLENHPIENAIKATALNLLAGGVDTTAIVLTWALSLVLNHKEVLKKAQNELDVNVGKERWVEESDIKDMVYIVAIVKETLRLYLAAPLSAPHMSMEDCNLVGYHVPKGTRLLVNIWKLHRDPRVWSNSEEFQPERFLTTHAKLDVRGKDFEYIPFSSGSKACPGISSAIQMSCLTLARVLQGFNLATPNDQNIDMSEGIGLTMPKTTPLEVILTPRLPNDLYLQE